MRTKIISSILLLFILFSLSGCEIFDAAVERAVEQTQTQKETVISKTRVTSPSQKQQISTEKPSPTVISSPIITTKTCTIADTITLNQKGETLEVCGEITDAGEGLCPECSNGYYAYLVLDNSFYILSYDWVFSSEWIGDCIMAKDIVESFGSKPAFVFGAQEGYDGSKCEYNADGTLFCKEGNYFQSYTGCK